MHGPGLFQPGRGVLFPLWPPCQFQIHVAVPKVYPKSQKLTQGTSRKAIGHLIVDLESSYAVSNDEHVCAIISLLGLYV